MEEGTSSWASSGSSHEVFLSFRGPDTRHGFTDCLYHGMVEAGILVFRDDESLHVGEIIGGQLLQAIEDSKIYIPIFSTNYASSHWCLRELACMVECASKSNGNKEILPIFLDVEPEDVKLKTNLYREALSKRQKTFCTIEVESWEKALIEVGKIKGWNLKKDQGQGDLIRSVVQAVLVKLNVRNKNVTKDLVGVDDRVEAIIKMLDVKSDNVRFLGIYGIGGVGKTTLAKVVFNNISSHFQGCNFLLDVRELSQRHGLVYLQKQLLSKFLDSHYINQIYDIDDGINMIKRVLCTKKVLIVLDDVDEKEQLKSLVGKGNWFNSGSKIIITTRDKRVLMIEREATGVGLVEKYANVSTYEVQELEFDHALELFSRHAFGRDSPLDDYVCHSKKVVSTLGKLPLALEVTGLSLFGKSEELWVDTLKKLKKAPPVEVRRTLMITYEKLDDAQKQVFLDIACFFINEDKTYPFYMWDDCGYYPHDAIEVLFLMSLIKIKDDNTFWMHDQVRNLGREIVRQENFKDPCKRSRVWNHKKARSILKWKEGSRKTEALSLGFCEDILTHDEFGNLQNLRFFQGDGVSFAGDFNNLLSNLRWLSWQYCSSKFAATNFHPTNLVVLNLSSSEITDEWIGWSQIRAASKLKVLDLRNCIYLMRTPDLSTWVSLERLILEGCKMLIEIDPSIGKLKLLTTLNLNGCHSLRELPEEIGCLQALTEIVLPHPQYPVILSEINKLPYSIGGLVKLRRLSLYGFMKIEELPDSVGKLQSLVELNLSWTSVGHLPDSIGNLKQLKVLKMSHVSGIAKLPSVIGLVEKLEELDASGCWNLTGEIPEEIGRLSCLRILNFSKTSITGLPSTVSRLSNLQKLNLKSCPDLRKLPELPPNLTCLRWAPDNVFDSYGDMPYEPDSITTLPTSIGTLSQLEELTLSCKNVQFLPQLPSSLRELKLGHLATTQSPDLSNLKNLSTLRMYSCSMLEFSGIFDAELEVLHMQNCKLRKLDALFQLEMERLRSLTMHWCEFLPEVLDLSGMKNLQEVDLYGCKLLVEIRGLEELGSLSILSVMDCSSMEMVSDLSNLRNLRMVRVRGCPELRSIKGLNHLEADTSNLG